MDRKRVGMVHEKGRFPFERKFLFLSPFHMVSKLILIPCEKRDDSEESSLPTNLPNFQLSMILPDQILLYYL